ncbi:MAG: prepilin-type N-terminal cleavage/methylation domain-containing protein [Candidatus Riflebacteria bacterium]|jgi:hypothetical protein|nr:prepilin-type N-terminal cleavage/methylation domain-containing protein [Candidatus Riflebacteria bacterium]
MKYRLGFTVVEIVIALVIIAVGFLPIYNLFRQGSVGTVNTINETEATNYASDLINLCKDLRYSSVTDKVSGNERKLENDTEIQAFFNELDFTPLPEVKKPFIRKMILTRFDRRKFMEWIKDLFSGRKKVETFKVEVTVTFPRNNTREDSPDRDEVTLYTLIMD